MREMRFSRSCRPAGVTLVRRSRDGGHGLVKEVGEEACGLEELTKRSLRVDSDAGSENA